MPYLLVLDWIFVNQRNSWTLFFSQWWMLSASVFCHSRQHPWQSVCKLLWTTCPAIKHLFFSQPSMVAGMRPASLRSLSLKYSSHGVSCTSLLSSGPLLSSSYSGIWTMPLYFSLYISSLFLFSSNKLCDPEWKWLEALGTRVTSVVFHVPHWFWCQSSCHHSIEHEAMWRCLQQMWRTSDPINDHSWTLCLSIIITNKNNFVDRQIKSSFSHSSFVVTSSSWKGLTSQADDSIHHLIFICVFVIQCIISHEAGKVLLCIFVYLLVLRQHTNHRAHGSHPFCHPECNIR